MVYCLVFAYFRQMMAVLLVDTVDRTTTVLIVFDEIKVQLTIF